MLLESINSARLVIRTDANSQIGTGHVMRCIALGQAWADAGGDVVFVTCCHNQELLQQLRHEGFTVVELSDPNEFLPRLSSDLCLFSFAKATADKPTSDSWVVLDGYQFTLEDQRTIRAAGCKLLVIDDCNHLPEYECDILLNQNVNAKELDYRLNPECRKLLGPDYVLLRREFVNVDAMSSSRSCGGERGGDTASTKEKTEPNVLVTMGGADPDNVTLKVIQALSQMDGLELQVKIVVGPANPHRAILETAIQYFTSNIQLIHSANMAELMRWADFSISAAGSTCWELLAMGVPFATVILAENQEGVARFLKEQGGIHCFGWVGSDFESDVADFLKKVCAEPPKEVPASCAVNGFGAGRVVEQLRLDKETN